MPRRHENKISIPFPKQEAYEKALTELEALQEECERPENRYYCPCISVADSMEAANGIRREYERFIGHLYPNGRDQPACPIDPKNVTPNEIFYRMLAWDDVDPETFFQVSEADCAGEITDGYFRWTPPKLPRTWADVDRATKRMTREIAKLEQRRDKGYASAAKPCETCLVTTPETDIPISGIMGVTSLFCEMARAQTPEEIAQSNADLETNTAPRANVWALKPPEGA